MVGTIEQIDSPVLAIGYSPNGQMIATGSRDNVVRVWNLLDGKLLNTFTGHKSDIHSVEFSPDNTQLAATSDKMLVWDLASGQVIFSTPDDRFVAFLPNENHILGLSDNHLSVYDYKMNQELSSYCVRYLPAYYGLICSGPDKSKCSSQCMGGTRALSISQSGNLLAAIMQLSAGDKTIGLYTPEEAKNYIYEDGTVHDIEFISGSNLLISSIWKTLKFWGTLDANLAYTIPNPDSRVTDIKTSPDGSSFATAEENGNVIIWGLSPSSENVSITSSPAPVVKKRYYLSVKNSNGMTEVELNGQTYGNSFNNTKLIPVYEGVTYNVKVRIWNKVNGSLRFQKELSFTHRFTGSETWPPWPGQSNP